jgi:glycolate oxidase FAD binding subunit
MDTERSVVPAALLTALAAACPAVREGSADTDAIAGVVPSFVASPASTEEASALLRIAATHGLTVVPRGAGTGLAWGQPPASCDLVLDMTAMDRVIEHAAGDLVARVQAGTTMGHLASVLASAGQQLAVDAPADATVGGVVATGTAGPRRFRYGAPRDLLIGITVIRADGVVAHSGGRVVKNVAGYDLGKLFSGSQGTLGLITEATFRLHPLPAAQAWVTGDLGPADLAAAAAAVASAAGSALVPSAVELLWTGGGPGASAGPAMLRVGILLEGTPSGVNERSRQMAELLAAAGATPIVAISETPFRWWEPESDAPVPSRGGLGGSSPRANTVVRVTFWVRQLADVLDALATAGASAGVRPAVSGAAGAGVLYARLDPATADDTAARFVGALRDRLAGVFAGSADGSGLVRGSVAVLAAPAAVLAMAGPDRPLPGLDLMRAVKDQFDPGHRMFPGRFRWGP